MGVGSAEISRKSFPEGFVFGTATSAYQVEGAVNQDHRGKSIWDTFSHQLGHILDLSNGDITDDQYNRYKEDVELMANMGVDVYRFSISWSRIYPNGNGSINPTGINHYNDLINALIFKGIKPYVTLYHWDLPQKLQDNYGGWLSSDIINDYVMFVETCFEAFGDRVKHWITFNEPYQFSLQGFGGFGTQAPGRCSIPIKCGGGNSSIEPYIVAKNVLLAHAHAVALYKEKYQRQQKGFIGITLDSIWYEPLNNSSEEDNKASKRALDFRLGWFLDPLVFGDYPPSMKELVGDRLPSLLNTGVTLKNSFDFIGLNHFTTNYVFSSTPSYISAAFSNINPDGQFDVTVNRNGELIGPQSPGASWLYVVPWGFKNLLEYIRTHYNNPTIIITENGYADLGAYFLGLGKGALSQALKDDERITYHTQYLSNLLLAIKSGSSIKGYIIWSLLDNWEWGLGFTSRFGLYFVDYQSKRQRYRKKSVQWFTSFLQD